MKFKEWLILNEKKGPKPNFLKPKGFVKPASPHKIKKATILNV